MNCVSDFEESAREVLAPMAWNYFEDGADDMITKQENRSVYERYYLIPRVLRDVTNVAIETELLGHRVAAPIGIAPVAMQKLAHHEGELATAKAASRRNLCFILSTYSTVSMDQIIAGTGGEAVNFFQLYVHDNRKVTEVLIKEAERLGFRGLVITVDAPILGKRLSSVRNGFRLPSHLNYENFNMEGVKALNVRAVSASELSAAATGTGSVVEENDAGAPTLIKSDPSFSWRDIGWIKKTTTLPVILKGVLSMKDIELAIQHDIDAIYVSNHGGRQLDGVPATLDILAALFSLRSKNRFQGKLPEIYVDGGVRDGTDILKALILGARAVFIGRPMVYGLAQGGEAGVERVLDILTEGLRHSMALCGVASLLDLNESLLVHRDKLLSRL